MNSFIAGVLLNTMKIVTDGDLMDKIVDFVGEAASFEISGEEKRTGVMRRIKDIGGELQPVVMATAGYLLNLAVEVAVAYLKSKSEK